MGFEKDELRVILTELISDMQKLGRNVEVLKGCGTNEDKIGDSITAAQRATFERLKINPDKGMANLKLIVRDFKSDPEIINVFGAMLQMEEMITVVTISRNGGKQVPPQQLQQMIKNIELLLAKPKPNDAPSPAATAAAQSMASKVIASSPLAQVAGVSSSSSSASSALSSPSASTNSSSMGASSSSPTTNSATSAIVTTTTTTTTTTTAAPSSTTAAPAPAKMEK